MYGRVASVSSRILLIYVDVPIAAAAERPDDAAYMMYLDCRDMFDDLKVHAGLLDPVQACVCMIMHVARGRRDLIRSAVAVCNVSCMRACGRLQEATALH